MAITKPASILQPDRWIVEKSGEVLKSAWKRFRAGPPPTEEQTARFVSVQAITSSGYEYVVANLEEHGDGSFSIRPEKPSVSMTKRVDDYSPQEFPDYEVATNSQTLITWSPVSAAERQRRVSLSTSDSLLRATDGLLVSRTPIAGSKEVGDLIPFNHDAASLENRGQLFAVIAERLGSEFDVYGYASSNAEKVAVEVGKKTDAPRYYDGEVWVLGKGRKPEEAEDLAVLEGRTVIEYRSHSNSVTVARLDPFVRGLRDRFAEQVGVRPWEVELTITMAVDETTGKGRIDSIAVRRSGKTLSVEAEKRAEFWSNFINLVPGGSRGWSVIEDSTNGRTSLRYGDVPTLPFPVPARELLPDAITQHWARKFIIGKNPQGEPVELNFEVVPHIGIAGETGSGKSVLTRMVYTQAIAHGWDVVLVDPTKKAQGLNDVEPYSLGVFKRDVTQAAEVVSKVYEEVRRRVDLNDAHNSDRWDELPAELNLKPIMLIIDEFAALMTYDAKPVAKGTPEYADWEESTTARDIIKNRVSKMALEARAAGIHLVIIMQRFDVTYIPGPVREQLGTILQLSSPVMLPSSQALGMTFGAKAKEASDVLEMFLDGKSNGLGAIWSEGGSVQAFRVGFLDKGADSSSYFQSINAPRRGNILHGIDSVTTTAEFTSEGRIILPKATEFTEVLNIWESQFQAETPVAPTVATPAPMLFPGDPAAIERTAP